MLRMLKGRSGPVHLHMSNIGRQAEGAARRCVPVKSGDLKGSIDSRVVRGVTGDWQAEVFSDLPYASWIEDGKRFDPRSGKTIRVKVGPRPCLREALRSIGLGRSRRVA